MAFGPLHPGPLRGSAAYRTNRSSVHGRADDHFFPFFHVLSSAFHQLDTDGAKDFTVRHYPLRHHYKSPLMDFINNDIFHIKFFHPGLPLVFGSEKPANPGASGRRRKGACGALANLGAQLLSNVERKVPISHPLSPGWMDIARETSRIGQAAASPGHCKIRLASANRCIALGARRIISQAAGPNWVSGSFAIIG